MDKPKAGSIAWQDLTVENADTVRDFYREVIGWKVQEVDMGGYADYSMVDSGGDGVAGVCHARGGNSGIPPQWLIYIVVEDLDHSLSRCRELGGSVISEPRDVGADRMAIVRDPAGAVCALYQVG
jgi:predicted enzyme related to lactoylglutathione lyase